MGMMTTSATMSRAVTDIKDMNSVFVPASQPRGRGQERRRHNRYEGKGVGKKIGWKCNYKESVGKRL